MPHVIVVGAGPAGAALSYLLARRGVQVTLVERQKDFAREFRGEALMPSGIDAFRQMGLSEEFAAVPQARPAKAEIHFRGSLVNTFGFDPLGDNAPRLVSQPALLEMLVAQCERHPGFRLLRGAAVRDLVSAGGRAVGVKLAGEHDGEHRADLVIGADGRGSMVRRRCGLEHPRNTEHFDVVWFKIPMADFLVARGSPVQAYFGRGQLAIAFPAADGTLQVGWIIRKGSFGDLRRRGREAWIADVARHLGPELGEHLAETAGAIDQPFVLDVVCWLLPRWHEPGVLLLGDAAHPMSPVGGQGLNIALRDALVAANHLVPALSAGVDSARIDAAITAFQREREPEARTIQRLQRVPPRIVMRGARWSEALLAGFMWLLRHPALLPGSALPPPARLFLHGATRVQLRV